MQEFLAAFHIVHQGTDRAGESASLGEKRWKVGMKWKVVAMFVAGLNGLKQSKLFVPEHCSYEHITLLHLLFESQNEILTTSMLGNEAIVRTVDTLHAAY